MEFDCKKFHDKCHALCCKCAPIEISIYERNEDKIVREVLDILEFTAIDPFEAKEVCLKLPITKDGYCPFLNKNLSCNIYEDRPNICKRYGSEQMKCLRCPYQNKNGEQRSRQESRKILREAEKEAQKLIKLGTKKIVSIPIPLLQNSLPP